VVNSNKQAYLCTAIKSKKNMGVLVFSKQLTNFLQSQLGYGCPITLKLFFCTFKASLRWKWWQDYPKKFGEYQPRSLDLLLMFMNQVRLLLKNATHWPGCLCGVFKLFTDLYYKTFYFLPRSCKLGCYYNAKHF